MPNMKRKTKTILRKTAASLKLFPMRKALIASTALLILVLSLMASESEKDIGFFITLGIYTAYAVILYRLIKFIKNKLSKNTNQS